MKRCDLCTRLIWPWQHYGFRVGMATWHTRCQPAPEQLVGHITRTGFRRARKETP